MSVTKAKAIELINALPDSITIDDIISELHFKLQVDIGLKELDEGKGVDHSDVEKRLDKWLKK